MSNLQLNEISDSSEKLPPTVRLTLPQTAVRSIGDLRIVETLDEFQSTTNPPLPFHTKHIMIFSSMLVLGMIRLKRPT